MRLLAVVIVLNLVAAALTGTIVVLTGRAAAGDETEASMRFASDFVNEAVRTMQASPGADLGLRQAQLGDRADRGGAEA